MALKTIRRPAPKQEVPLDPVAQALQQARGQIALLERQDAANKARERFLPFVKFTSPDPEEPNDVKRSRYQDAKHHRAIARNLEALVLGEVEHQILVLVCPPRHGKSELVSRRLPAWVIGKFPRWNGVVATYNDDFAADFGKEVRSIIKTPQFRQVFPNVGLLRGGAASDRLQTTDGGQWSFVGRGGSLTGRGAHCLPAETMVETPDGAVPIASLRRGQKVLSYDIRNRQIVWKAVEAIQHRPAARLFRITTAAGRVVEATSDHRFYANGRWIEAAQLAAGDHLVCALRGDLHEAGLRPAETSGARADGILLQHPLPGGRNEHQAFRGADVLPLRRACATSEVMRDAGDEADILFAGLHGAGAERGIRTAGAGADEAMRAVQCDVHAGEFSLAVLQPAVCVEGARGSDGEGRQPPLEGWSGGQSGEAACYATVSGVAPVGYEAGRAEMRALLRNDLFGSAPYRREPVEQPGDELGDALPALSREGAFFFGAGDTVASVADARRDADVYDIQVEETECFFANGVLVHNCLICDDLIKDDKEAQSQAIRDQAWSWFTRVAMTRRMGRKIVIMTFTRWHADDPIGRLTDPENPHYNETLARKIKIINLPAIAEEDDPIGRRPGEALWPDGPDKFDLDFLETQKSLDPIGFAALYQGRPSLQDGDLYQRETIRFYRPSELPADLRIYCASDHAVGQKQRADYTVLLKYGLDPLENVYLLDCFWRKAKSDIVVEAMLGMMGGNMRPLLWFAENGHISKAIGPFLRKRMVETSTYVPVRELTPAVDKVQRAQSMIGRAGQGKLFFPQDAIWTEKAINQMMAFPAGTHDDFVDVLSLIGMALQSQFAASRNSDKKKAEQPAYGTFAWIKAQDRLKERDRQRRLAGGF